MLSLPIESRPATHRRSCSAAVLLMLLALAIPTLSDAADANPPDSLSRPQSEPPQLVITGRVIDHETKQPIGLGCVVPGVGEGASHVAWDTTASVMVLRGRYEFNCKADAIPQVLKAFAGDYQIEVSKVVAGKAGTASVDFELTKLPLFEATVRTPDGRPAVGAKVAVVLDDELLTLDNGDFDEAMLLSVHCRTDEFGKFQFRLRPQRFQLAITHDFGYAFFRPTANSKSRTITLDPWSHVEGTLQFDGMPVDGMEITISRDKGEFDWVSETARTDRRGRFVFDRVLFGRGSVGYFPQRLPGSHDLHTQSSCWFATRFGFGQTVQVDLGGRCRRVVGKLRLPPSFKTQSSTQPPWSDVLISVETAGASRLERGFATVVANDGTFCLDNVPEGTYLLRAALNDSPKLCLAHPFSVSIPADAASAPPLDLGLLTLKRE